MKIPFDIKFRPQIESGEYKVVTGDDRPVRIISWDKKVYGGRFEIVALVPTSQGDTETVQLYCPDGTLLSSNWNEKFKLFIITQEPELTEFERGIKRGFLCAGLEYVPTGIIKDTANELLAIAKKEICKGCSIGLDEYWRGRKEALDEASRGYHYEGPCMPTYYPCPNGGNCTNPFRDCMKRRNRNDEIRRKSTGSISR